MHDIPDFYTEMCHNYCVAKADKSTSPRALKAPGIGRQNAVESDVRPLGSRSTTILFLNTEVGTGLTFARLSEQATNAEKRTRNRLRARAAYDAVLKYIKMVSPEEGEELQLLQNKIMALRKALESLGEQF